MSDIGPDEIRGRLATCPEWFHSIELAPGIVTPGRWSVEALARKWEALHLPVLSGKSVLDVGAYDGFFSFAAERAGAVRVVPLDHYVWSADMVAYMADWRASNQAGSTSLPAPHASPHWAPETMPGRRPFDLAHEILRSRVIPVVGDFMAMDLSTLGQFDVVLFLGILYHLTDPLGAMQRVAQVTAADGLAVIETAAIEIPGLEHRAHWEFFPGQELNNDASNWWVPNATALEGLCRSAGFRDVIRLTPHPVHSFRARLGAARREVLHALGLRPSGPDVTRYRLVAHARRQILLA